MKTEKLSQAISELDSRYIQEAVTYKRRAPTWVKWTALAACLCLAICGFALPRLTNEPADVQSGDLAPMVRVNGTVYRGTGAPADLTGREGQLVYLGAVSSKVDSTQYPSENFQANDDIVGSEIYRLGDEIYIKIDGQYWTCAEMDVSYTANPDGTFTCRGTVFKYKLDVTGLDGDSQVTYTVLTNDPDITFEDIRQGLIKAEADTGAPDFIILSWRY